MDLTDDVKFNRLRVYVALLGVVVRPYLRHVGEHKLEGERLVEG
jgi:hypothetical protein